MSGQGGAAQVGSEVRPERIGSGLFRSFWMGGFEGADHINSHGTALCLNQSNGHWQQLAEDYARVAAIGIHTIRESIGWRASTSTLGKAQCGLLRQRAELACAHGLQVIWTIHHYGNPSEIDFFAPSFPDQFADFCGEVSAALSGVGDGPPFYQPVNEISFLSWAATSTHLIHPYDNSSAQRGYELKCQLVKASLRGCDAIWANEPQARMVHTDPLIYVVAAPQAGLVAQAEAAGVFLSQFQAWDMISGRVEPNLGGAPKYLDILGANYYHSNQWVHPSVERLQWHLDDHRRCNLDELLNELWARYRRPIFIAETSHVGDGRATWLDDIAQAALRAMERGVPLEGICLYPLIDRTDWEDSTHWHHSGLWDVYPRPALRHETPVFTRVLHEPYAERLLHWQRRFLVKGEQPAQFINQPEDSMFPLIVFSHLRWDFVYQRPQQLLSRMAARRQVIFVEEPMTGASHPVLERLHPCKGVEVLRCHVTGNSPGFATENFPVMRALLAAYLAQHRLKDYWLWFYTPMALPLAEAFEPAGVVYDCMDELSAFRHAPPELLLREDQLFEVADLVFTGGHSLFDAKRLRHSNVSCFPSSVDAAHYARPAPPANQTDEYSEPLQEHIGRPRLGYCGVIDERLDIGLIEAMADARPKWQIVMVGPVLKIDQASLPQRPNIHWLGQQDYAYLPSIIHGWDVCLMPFALNESTRFISPTKTLEYLAAGCPVVSTPIRDVVTGYPSIVAVADSPAGFIAACEAALSRSAEQVDAEVAAVQQLLDRTSWDRTAHAMTLLMAEFEQAGLDKFDESDASRALGGHAENGASTSQRSHSREGRGVSASATSAATHT